MKAELMSHLGINERQASQMISSLPSSVLNDMLEFVVGFGPHAKTAVVAALPSLLHGSAWGAVKAATVNLLTLIPQPSLSDAAEAVKEAAPAPPPPAPPPPAPPSLIADELPPSDRPAPPEDPKVHRGKPRR